MVSVYGNTMHLYFAYGSNMDALQMKDRCPDAQLLGPATLPGYTLAFTIYSPKRNCGCADIVVKEGENVHGLLYRLHEEDLARMDGFEGHPIHYQRIIVSVEHGGSVLEAHTYEVVTKEKHIDTSR